MFANLLDAKFILFDMGGVVFENPDRERIKIIFRIFNLRKEQKKKALAEFKKLEKRWMCGNITERDFLSKILKKGGVKAQKLKKFKPICGKLFEKVYKEKKETGGIVKKLKKSGYKLGVLSNAGFPDVECIRKKKFFSYFDKAFFSCKLGYAKLDLIVYRKVLKVLGIRASNLVFIDDMERNVSAARKVGIKAILFRDARQLKKDLGFLGVIV